MGEGGVSNGRSGMGEDAFAAAVTAMAYKAIPPDAIDKDERVRQLVTEALEDWTASDWIAGTWWSHVNPDDKEAFKIDRGKVEVDHDEIRALVTREEPESQRGQRWRLVGQRRGPVLFGVYYPDTPKLNALSYGTFQLYWIKESEGDGYWQGFYVRARPEGSGNLSSKDLFETVPIRWQREDPRASSLHAFGARTELGIE